MLIDHVTLQVSEISRSRRFYEAVLDTLGVQVLSESEDHVGFAGDGEGTFWLIPAEREAERELHLAFSSSDRESVRAFFVAAKEVGAPLLHAPRIFPEYHENYFAAFVRDPDGHNVEAVCHRAER